MKRFLHRILCFFTFLIWTSVALAQDSTNTDAQLAEMKTMLHRYEQQRVLDSIRIAQLVKNLTPAGKIDSIKSNVPANDSLKVAVELRELEQLRAQTKGYPVTLFSDTIFEVFTPLGTFTPKQRAEVTHDKIVNLYNLSTYEPDSLKLQEQFGQYNINYQNDVILSVTAYDALWMDQDMKDLSNHYLQNIKYSIDKNRELHTWEQIALRWAQVLIILVVAYLVWVIIRKLLSRLVFFLSYKSQNIVKDIKIKKYELVDRKFILRTLIRIIKIGKTILLLVIVYFSISFILNVFPITQKYTHTLWTFVFDPIKEIGVGIINYIPNLFRIAALIIVFRYLITAVRYFSIEIEKGDLKIRHFHKDWARTTYQIIRILLVAFCIILVFPHIPGSETDAFKGISVFAGVLISFGSSSAISNTIAGFVITYMRPFRVGDWIKVGEDIGKVVEKTLLVTRIQTINNEDITIPNSTILSKHTKNYSANYNDDGLVISAEVTFAYAIEWRSVHDVLISAAKKTNYTNPDKDPYVFQNTLDEYFVTYQINVYTKRPDKMYFIHTELLQNIQDGFLEAGIDLHLPAQISIKP